MRELDIGSKKYTVVTVMDGPGEGGACHEYCISQSIHKAGESIYEDFCHVKFQNGPIKEAGVNGCHGEDLIAILIDRLQHFQKGDFACQDNDLALGHLHLALKDLNRRTKEREDRGVEGTNVK